MPPPPMTPTSSGTIIISARRPQLGRTPRKLQLQLQLQLLLLLWLLPQLQLQPQSQLLLLLWLQP